MPTLLVVDDEPGVRQLACRALRAAGYTCLEAHSGRMALGLIQAADQPIDAMVVDVRLPDISGVDLVGMIREKRPGTAALFISGYAQPVVEHPELQVFLQPFLAKPFTPDQLLAALGELVPPP